MIIQTMNNQMIKQSGRRTGEVAVIRELNHCFECSVVLLVQCKEYLTVINFKHLSSGAYTRGGAAGAPLIFGRQKI